MPSAAAAYKELMRRRVGGEVVVVVNPMILSKVSDTNSPELDLGDTWVQYRVQPSQQNPAPSGPDSTTSASRSESIVGKDWRVGVANKLPRAVPPRTSLGVFSRSVREMSSAIR